MAFRAVIEAAGLTLSACASTIGVDNEVFQQWADGQRELPSSYASTLAAILGLKPESLTSKSSAGGRGAVKAEPAAIWFKFRGSEFTEADRESVLLIRRLGHNANLLDRAIDGQANRSWTLLFQNVMEKIDVQSSPQEQGRTAAQSFCSLTQFSQGGKGSSEFLRAALRAKGILIIESPIAKSGMEGCTFLVGDSSEQRPCIFVNTFSSTWFRRNVVIMHELAHALFDQNSGVEVDRFDLGNDSLSKSSITELRAESFARACLLPKSLLISFCSQSGTAPNKLTVASLAALVAFSGVEKKTVVEIMREHELIDEDLSCQYHSFDIADELRKMTDHALSTKEYIEKIGLDSAGQWINKRATNISSRSILLPVNYINVVIQAVRSFKISVGKACELLMIDKETFTLRFIDLLGEVDG